MPLEKVSENLRGKKDSVYITDSSGVEPETTSIMPVVPHKVLVTDIPFYSDAACTQQVEDAKIAILRPLDADGVDSLDVVPCRKHYSPGQYVTWNLNHKKIWEDCYYRNPFSGKIEPAWTIHVEFVGKVVEEQVVEKNIDRIHQLEDLYPGDRDLRSQIM